MGKSKTTFKKGQQGLGRPPGTENKVTSKIKEGFQKLLEDNLPQLQDDLNQMRPVERANFLKDLAEYILPKRSRVDEEGNSENVKLITVITGPEQ